MGPPDELAVVVAVFFNDDLRPPDELLGLSLGLAYCLDLHAPS